MRRKIVLKVIILIGLMNFSSSFFKSNSEDIFITTFYPSPYGIYNQLRLEATDTIDPLAVCSDKGKMYYDDSDSQMYVCDGANWQSSERFWTLNGDDIYPNDMNLNVGIGTNSPSKKLHVVGNMQVDGDINITGAVSGFDVIYAQNERDYTTINDNVIGSINCPVGYTLSGGGGYCSCTGGVGISRLMKSYPMDATNWRAGCKKYPVGACAEHTLTVYVYCIKVE